MGSLSSGSGKGQCRCSRACGSQCHLLLRSTFRGKTSCHSTGYLPQLLPPTHLGCSYSRLSSWPHHAALTPSPAHCWQRILFSVSSLVRNPYTAKSCRKLMELLLNHHAKTWHQNQPSWKLLSFFSNRALFFCPFGKTLHLNVMTLPQILILSKPNAFKSFSRAYARISL